MAPTNPTAVMYHNVWTYSEIQINHVLTGLQINQSKIRGYGGGCFLKSYLKCEIKKTARTKQERQDLCITNNSDSPLKRMALFMFPIIITLYRCLSLIVYKQALDSPPSKAVYVFIALLELGTIPACMKHLKRNLAEALKRHQLAHAFKSELHSSHHGLWPRR